MAKGKKLREPGRFRQLIAALVANLSGLSFGMTIGWLSPTIPQLQSNNSPVGDEPMTDEAVSWLTGITCLAAALVSLVAGMIANRCGRKVAGCLMALPLCASWLFVIFATEHLHLFIARFLAGIGGGMSLFLVPQYISEIASDGIRGMLGSLLVFLLNGGILLGYILGAFLSYTVFSIVGLAFPLFYIAFFIFMPESPVYLIRRNRLGDATRSLTWLRGGHKATVERETLHLQTEAKNILALERSIRFSDLFRDQATIKGLFITLGLFGGQQLAGISIMISYTETIFRLAGSMLSPNNSAIFVGVIQVLGSWLSTVLMERAGRRPLLLTSCFVMGLCHYALGVFSYLQTLQYDVSGFSWISIVALSMYMITYGLGMGPGPYVISSEILSRDVSNLVLTIGMSFVWTVAFVVVKLFPNVIALFDTHGCFFLLGSFCMISFVFVFVSIPETKGQPRQVILDHLNGVSRALDNKRSVSSSNVVGKNTPHSELI